MIQRVRVIINPAAGQDVPVLHTINRVFARYDIKWKADITHKEGDARHYAQKATQRKKTECIIVYGGDGTVMEVINGLIGGDKPLAILPGGTGNAVATEFGIAQNLERALEQICKGSGEFKPIDVGLANGTYFLLRADTGISAEVMTQTNRAAKNRFGVLAYMLTAARAVGEGRYYRYRVTVDGQTYETAGAACVIANIGSLGTLNLKLGSTVKYDDGLLDVFILKTDARALLVSVASILDLAELDQVFDHWQGRDIRIETGTPYPMNCDAEPCGETPIQASVIPHALQVFVPNVGTGPLDADAKEVSREAKA